MSNITTKRLTKEQSLILSHPPPGVSLLQQEGDSLMRWHLKLEGAKNTLYEGETFILRFIFSSQYPLESPEVIFEEPVPEHPHVYSNGHICLSVLYNDWTPALNISTLCLSIQSMLSSCTKKERPSDDKAYLERNLKSPKEGRWVFHGKVGFFQCFLMWFIFCRQLMQLFDSSKDDKI